MGRAVFYVILIAVALALLVGLYYWVLPLYRRGFDRIPMTHAEREKAGGFLKKHLWGRVWDRFDKAGNIPWKSRRFEIVSGVFFFLVSVGFTSWCAWLIAQDRSVLLGFGLLPLALSALLFFLFYYPLVYVWREPFVVTGNDEQGSLQ